MTIVTYHFDLIIKDGAEVMLWPAKGEPRKLPPREAQHVLAFLGVSTTPISVAERVRVLGKPLEDAPQHVTKTGVKILNLLGSEAKVMLVKEIASALEVPIGTAGSAIFTLNKNGLVIKSYSPTRHRGVYEISSAGIDWLAAQA